MVGFYFNMQREIDGIRKDKYRNQAIFGSELYC